MKHKPVKEGYKWFVLADNKTSYILNLTPDGRSAGQKGRGIDETNKTRGEHGKIWSCVRYLLHPLIDVVEKTKKKFVVAMDNYFTLPKVRAMMCECGIGTVGTARFCGTWPSACI